MTGNPTTTASERPPEPDPAGAPPEAGEGAPAPAARYDLSRHIVCLSDPGGAAAESVRSLRAHLLATHVREGRRSLAVCGPSTGVGCTHIAVNLAVTFAQTGLNTLLIDANLHRPGLESYIRPEEPANGLRQMLAADPTVYVDEVRREVLPNLSLLYAGGAGGDPSELIANRNFKGVLDRCIRDFEMTIVDTSAEGGTADIRRVAMNTRYALIVARRDRTLLSSVRSLADELINDRVRVSGTVLTDF